MTGSTRANRRVDGRASRHRQDRVHRLDRDRQDRRGSRRADAQARHARARRQVAVGRLRRRRLDAAVAGALYGVYYNAGQCCEARSRILVQSRHLRSLRRAASPKRRKRLRVGDPEDPQTQIGAITLREQYEKIKEYCEIGVAEGANALFGGGRRHSATRSRGGMFWSPTAFEAEARTASRARRSSARSRPSSVSTTKPKRSHWPTRASTVSRRASGRRTSGARIASRARFAADRSRSTRRTPSFPACRSAATSSPDTAASWEWRRCGSTAKRRACSPTSARNRWTRSGYSG